MKNFISFNSSSFLNIKVLLTLACLVQSRPQQWFQNSNQQPGTHFTGISHTSSSHMNDKGQLVTVMITYDSNGKEHIEERIQDLPNGGGFSYHPFMPLGVFYNQNAQQGGAY